MPLNWKSCRDSPPQNKQIVEFVADVALQYIHELYHPRAKLYPPPQRTLCLLPLITTILPMLLPQNAIPMTKWIHILLLHNINKILITLYPWFIQHEPPEITKMNIRLLMHEIYPSYNTNHITIVKMPYLVPHPKLKLTQPSTRTILHRHDIFIHTQYHFIYSHNNPNRQLKKPYTTKKIPRKFFTPCDFHNHTPKYSKTNTTIQKTKSKYPTPYLQTMFDIINNSMLLYK